ncbi:unnamed protein product, partial [Thlaspi arvense]
MGRVKLEIKRIDNTTNRQVTFSKRRNGNFPPTSISTGAGPWPPSSATPMAKKKKPPILGSPLSPNHLPKSRPPPFSTLPSPIQKPDLTNESLKLDQPATSMATEKCPNPTDAIRLDSPAASSTSDTVVLDSVEIRSPASQAPADEPEKSSKPSWAEVVSPSNKKMAEGKKIMTRESPATTRKPKGLSSSRKPPLKALKSIIKTINREQYSNLQLRVLEALDKLTICQRNLLSSPTPAIAALEKEAHKDWMDLAVAEELFLHQRSRVTWVECGDRNTAFFHRYMAVRRSANQIHYILDSSGVKHETIQEIQRCCVDFYSNLLGEYQAPLTDLIRKVIDTLTTIELPNPERGEDLYLWKTGNTHRDFFSTAHTWEEIRPVSPPVPWHKAVWFKGYIPKHAFTFWVAQLDRLPVRTRLVKWGQINNASCCLCNLHDETRDHLLLHCEISIQVWKLVFRRLGEPTVLLLNWSGLVSWMLDPSPQMPLILKLLAAHATIFSIWKERNSRLHESTSHTVDHINTGFNLGAKQNQELGSPILLVRFRMKTQLSLLFLLLASGYYKAYELSILCDIDIALLMFSPSDRLSLFSGKTRIEDVFTRFINLPDQERENALSSFALSFSDQSRCSDFQSKEYLLRTLQQLKTENDIALQLTNPAAMNSDVEEFEQEVYKLQQQQHMAEEELRFTTMEEYETCEKQLMDILVRVNERREHILSDQLSSYEASTIQHQNIGGLFVNDIIGGWLAENELNQAHLFDASAHSTMYETLLQGSSSSLNQNNNIMSECHLSNPNGVFQQWAQAYTSNTGLNPSALFPHMQQHQYGVVGFNPKIKKDEIPLIKREAKIDHEVSDYDIRMF